MRLSALLCLLLLSACSGKKPADLLIHHARIYTVDSRFSVVEALVVKDGKIIATGSNEAILKAYQSDSIVDAEGASVYPGFIDAHAHFVEYGHSLFEVNLFGCKSWDEVVARVSGFIEAHPGEPWIRGRGWDQNTWKDKSFPDNTRLNAFGNTAILLDRVDGHAAIVNDRALQLSGISAGQTIAGGTIGTGVGKLSGLLIDNAVALVTRNLPQPAKADYERWLSAAQAACFAQGLTTITDCGLGYRDIEAIDSLQRAGKLLMRLYIMMSDDTANYRRYLSKGPYKTDRLFLKGVKVYADGALGSRGACLLQPYADKPGWRGFLLSSQSHFDSVATMLAGTGFQMCTHAIGDSGNRVVLQLYNRVLGGAKNDRRWRIEHAQVVAPEDFALFGKASIIPSVQPTHATSDMYWAAQRLGASRMKGAYAYRQLLEQNGWLPLGTDFPVEDISPFKTFYAAVARMDAAGFPAGGFQKENALTREQALRGMTIWAAKGDFLERETGSIEQGKAADLVFLDRDLMQVPDSALLAAKVLRTYVTGQRVYTAARH